MNQLKASDPKNTSSSIVVSFHHHWLDLLQNNRVSVVFRKRGPRHIEPEWLYVYVGQPESSIVGRLPVNDYAQLKLDEALKLAKEGQISQQELKDYARTYNKLAVFEVGQFQVANPFISKQTLADNFRFFPPQSFMILSIEGKIALDKLAGFEK